MNQVLNPKRTYNLCSQKNRTNEAKKILNNIVTRLKQDYDPEQIILFGSYAYGNPTDESDIDLLIVKDTQESVCKIRNQTCLRTGLIREISQKATAFYFLERYPFFAGELSKKEVENAYNDSLKLIGKVEKLHKQIGE